MEPMICVVEIGTKEIKIATGLKNNTGNIDVISIAKTKSRGIKRGIVFNIEYVTNDLKKAIDALEKENAIIPKTVICNINGQHIQPVSDSVSNIKLNIHDNIFVQAAAIKNIEKCLNNVKLEVKQFVPESIASLFALNKKNIVSVNIGEDLVNISIDNNGKHQLLTAPHQGKIDEFIQVNAEFIKSHCLYEGCVKIVIHGTYMSNKKLLQTIHYHFPGKEVEYASFPHVSSRSKNKLNVKEDTTLLGLLRYGLFT